MRISLRTYLVLLLLAAIVPLFGLLMVEAWLHQNEAIGRATDNLKVAASSLAANQERVVESAHQILGSIANSPGLADGKTAGCQRYLSTLKNQFPVYISFGLVGLDGYMLCHSEVNRPLGFFGDRDYFQAALARRGFVTGGYFVGRATGKPSVPFAMPVMNSEGKVTAVAFAAIDLKEISKALADSSLPPGGRLLIMDRQGIVLAASPPNPAMVGQQVPSPFLQDAVKTMRTGVGEGLDGEGRQRILAFLPTGKSADSPFFLVVSVDKAGVIAPARTELVLEFMLLALLGFLGGWLAWVIGTRAIVKPTTELLEATRQLQQGQLDVRIPISAGDDAGEFSRIAAGFNRMAESLQTQRAALEAELVRSRAVQEKMQDAQCLGRIGYWQSNLDTQMVWWSDEVYEVLGVDRALLGNTFDGFLERVHPDDREAYGSGRDATFQAGMQRSVEYRVVTSTGEVRWIHQFGRAHVNAEGEQGRRRAGVLQDITERKLAEESVRVSEARLRRAELASKAGNWEFHWDTQTINASDGAIKIYGLAGVALDYSAIRAIALPQYHPLLDDALKKLLNENVPYDIEFKIRTLNTDEIKDIHSVAVFDAEKRILFGVIRDITERKLAEQELRDSEQRYAALFEAAPVPMWLYDIAAHQFLAVNQAAIHSYGYSAEEFLSMTIFDIRPEAEHDRLRQRLAEEVPRRTESWQHRRKDASVFPVKVVSQSIHYAGRSARFVVALDITDQIKAEKDVQDYLFTLQRAADAAQAITWHQTLQGTLQEVAEQARGVIGAHQAAVSLTIGNERAQTVGALSLSEKYAQYRDLIEPMDGSGIRALVCETNRALRMTQAELEAHPRWRGFGRYASKHPPMRGWLAVPLTDRDGKNIGLLQLSDKYEGEFTQQDEYVAMELAQLVSSAIENARLIEEVSQLNTGLEQKVAERTAALARQEALFRALADQAPQVVWTQDPNGAVTYFNRAWFDLVGGKLEDWIGPHRWHAVVHPEDLPDVKARWETAHASRSEYEGLRRLRAKDGSYHAMTYRASPVFDDRGEVLFWVGIDADITEIKVVEAALRLSNQELEAFSYSVSHDLRSPLNTIDGFSQLLAKQLAESDNEKAQHYLSRIRAGTAQMGQLIGDLLSLAHVARTQMNHEPVDLSALSRGILDDLQARQPERQMALHIEPGLQAQGDAGLLRVVLENLLGNACKFSSQQAQAEISIGQKLDAAGEPVFFVQDNGAGFDMAYADKLFHPFQRLHAVAEFPGTGIGLATVSRVIARHGGRIWADAAPGRGATFFFTLSKVPVAGLGGRLLKA